MLIHEYDGPPPRLPLRRLPPGGPGRVRGPRRRRILGRDGRLPGRVGRPRGRPALARATPGRSASSRRRPRAGGSSWRSPTRTRLGRGRPRRFDARAGRPRLRGAPSPAGAGGIADRERPAHPAPCPRSTWPPRPPSARSRPADFAQPGSEPAQVEGLILKFLLNIGVASGRRIAEELGLPFGPFPEFLRQLKNQQIVAYTNSADGQRLPLLADRRRPGPGQGLLRGVRLRRHGPGAVRRLRQVRRRPDDPGRAAQGGRPPPGLLRPADLRGDVRHPRPGDQLGPRDVPLRLPRQRQDQHRRADHPLLRHERSGSPRSSTSTGTILKLYDPANHEPIVTAPLGPAPRRRLRPPLDRDPPADDHRRRRAADGRPGDPLRPDHQDQRGPAAA